MNYPAPPPWPPGTHAPRYAPSNQPRFGPRPPLKGGGPREFGPYRAPRPQLPPSPRPPPTPGQPGGARNGLQQWHQPTLVQPASQQHVHQTLVQPVHHPMQQPLMVQQRHDTAGQQQVVSLVQLPSPPASLQHTGQLWELGEPPALEHQGHKGGLVVTQTGLAMPHLAQGQHGQLINPQAGLQNNPMISQLINPQNGQLINPQNSQLMNPRISHIISPQNGQLINPQNGQLINPQNGQLINPQNGQLINPQNAHLFNPQNAHLFNPQNGQLINPQNGQLINPQNGQLINLLNGQLINPQNGQLINPLSGQLINSQNSQLPMYGQLIKSQNGQVTNSHSGHVPSSPSPSNSSAFQMANMVQHLQGQMLQTFQTQTGFPSNPVPHTQLQPQPPLSPKLPLQHQPSISFQPSHVDQSMQYPVALPHQPITQLPQPSSLPHGSQLVPQPWLPPTVPPPLPLSSQPTLPFPPPNFSQPPPPYSLPPPKVPPDIIPDLRQEFLATQLRPAPGQLVVLPPLTQDRSLQTIQLLTPSPAHPGAFHVQTVVLPIQRAQAAPLPLPAPPPPSPQPLSTEESQPGQQQEPFLNQVDGTGLPSVMQGVDLEQVKLFASEFKSARLQLGLTQTQVGLALTNTSEEQAVSQSTICRFEKLEITAQQVKKLLPQLQAWLAEARRRDRAGLPVLNSQQGDSAAVLEGRENKKRKKRTVFNSDTVAELSTEFLANPSPTAGHVSDMADRLGLDKETVRVWFCNKRQQNRKTTGCSSLEQAEAGALT